MRDPRNRIGSLLVVLALTLIVALISGCARNLPTSPASAIPDPAPGVQPARSAQISNLIISGTDEEDPVVGEQPSPAPVVGEPIPPAPTRLWPGQHKGWIKHNKGPKRVR